MKTTKFVKAVAFIEKRIASGRTVTTADVQRTLRVSNDTAVKAVKHLQNLNVIVPMVFVSNGQSGRQPTEYVGRIEGSEVAGLTPKRVLHYSRED